MYNHNDYIMGTITLRKIERALRIEGRNTVKLKGNFYGKAGMSGSDSATQTQPAGVETTGKW
jgi:hypothetical protein